MWNVISTLATIFTGLAAATTLQENMQRSAERAAERRALKLGTIRPKDAAKALEHRLGGHVEVGKDHEGYKLIVIKTRSSEIPEWFGGYRVGFRPRIHEGG